MDPAGGFTPILLARLAGFALQHDDFAVDYVPCVRAFRADRPPVAGWHHSPFQNSAIFCWWIRRAGSDTWPCQNRSRRSR